MRGRDQLAGLLAGVPPARIGWGPGPLTALRRARHRLLRRPVRLALLEHSDNGTRFAAPHAFWINQRSRVCAARVNDIRGADVVWVFSQDPLPPAARDSLAEAVSTASGAAAVVNGVQAYDAYHRDDAFPRLAAAGVSVPRTAFTDADLGRTQVVYKAQWQQPAAKQRGPWSGPLPGHRAFEYVDGRGDDGLSRRYRAFWLCGRSWPDVAFTSPAWDVTGHTRTSVDAYELSVHERRQIELLARTLELDFFAVDFLRRRDDGAPVFVDVNVYPTIVTTFGGDGRRECGQWHVWDADRRLVTAPPAQDVWREFDEVVLELASRG